jgi:glycosyltransferase involved in cell wall biosynthesis
MIPQITTDMEEIQININKNDLNLFYPAGFIPYKNHAILFKAFSLIDKKLPLKKITLFLTVDYDFNSLYKFNNIKILSMGKVSHNTVSFLYKKIDVLLFPSYIETFGLPLIEAASVGLPIIASNLPYAKEVLYGYNGVSYVDYYDAEAWANKLLELSFNPKNKFTPFQVNNRNSWNDFFKIIKQKI